MFFTSQKKKTLNLDVIFDNITKGINDRKLFLSGYSDDVNCACKLSEKIRFVSGC